MPGERSPERKDVLDPIVDVHGEEVQVLGEAVTPNAEAEQRRQVVRVGEVEVAPRAPDRPRPVRWARLGRRR